MLTCIRKAFDLIGQHHQTSYTLATLPPEDPVVYDMLCKADSIGVFQVEITCTDELSAPNAAAQFL